LKRKKVVLVSGGAEGSSVIQLRGFLFSDDNTWLFCFAVYVKKAGVCCLALQARDGEPLRFQETLWYFQHC